MKRRRVIIIASACLAAVLLALLLRPREREPEYNGATLSTWLARCSSKNQTESLAAEDAVRHIGTNALPFLLRWIQHEPGWKDSVADGIVGRAILKWHVAHGGRMVPWLYWNMTAYRAMVAADAFRILGSQANPALPELQRLAEDYRKTPQTALRATDCMLLMTQRYPDGDFGPMPERVRSTPY